MGISEFYVFEGNYTFDEFFKGKNFIFESDNVNIFDEYVYFYAQYVYYNSEDEIISGSTIYMDAVTSCFDFVVMKIDITKIIQQ